MPTFETNTHATRLRVAYDMHLPQARWGPMFHVFCLERPHVRLEWRPVGFPVPGRSLLEDADIGVFVQPVPEPGVRVLTLDTSPMFVFMAVGHSLARHEALMVAHVLDEPFPGAMSLDPQWCAFWTLDAQRGRPARRTGDDVATTEEVLAIVAAGQAIATLPGWAAGGLSHPGVVALALTDAPPVRTCLLWRTDEGDPSVLGLVDLAAAWTGAAPADRRRRTLRRRGG